MDEIACAASGRATPRAMGCGVKAAPFIIGAEPFIIGAAWPFDAGAAWPFEWPFAAGVGFRTPLSPKGSKEDSAAGAGAGDTTLAPPKAANGAAGGAAGAAANKSAGAAGADSKAAKPAGA